ncbi:MAG TPA: serine hydrolase domain-containing protein [Myxococcales bacterium]|nr:serine hydrolase domain-containing protein [Myxococcales bacterium]
MRLRPAVLACSLALASPLLAARADEIDSYLEPRLRSLHIPGATLAVVREGRIVKVRGYGLANLELGVPAGERTVYELGSTTKQFTAAAVLLLVEEGKIGLDDPLARFFPRVPQAWHGITVRHLLTHTSGIQDHVAVPGYLKVFRTDLFFETTPGLDELVGLFFKLPLEFQPGETWAYDNTGYILLGRLIEKASGRPYWAFLEERIFRPLGMTATRSTDPQPLVPGRAAGYEWVAGAFQNRAVLLPGIAFSAGALLSTVGDLARWDAALYGEKLLRRSSREQMWAPARAADGSPLSFDYGFGWFLDSYHGHRLVQHSGGTPGFSSAFYRFPDDKLTIALLTNHGDRVLDHLVVDIAGIVEPSLRRPEGKPDPAPQTTLLVKGLLSDLLRGKPDLARFTGPMRIFLRTTVGKALWAWLASLGELRSVAYSEEERGPSGRVLRYRVVLGEDPCWFTVVLAGDGRIAQIRWW